MASNATIVGESSQENLKRKRSNVSAVWQYFEKLDTEGQSKCLLCKTIVNSGGSRVGQNKLQQLNFKFKITL